MRIRIKNAGLAAAMARSGLSGLKLAQQCGLHPVTVSALLNRRQTPKPETAEVIANVLAVPASTLFPEEVADDC